MSPSDASHLVIATAVILAILLGAVAMVVDAHRNPFCPDCYVCQKKRADREVAAGERGHRDYHYWTDRDSAHCMDKACPGLPKKKGR